MLVHDYLTSSSWLTCVKPISFRALIARKFLLNWLNTNSIGLRSGLYAKLYTKRNLSRLISVFDRGLMWTPRLSMNRQILSSPLAALKP